MAPRVKTVSEQIDVVVNALGGGAPNLGEIRGRLITAASDARGLESGRNLADSENQIAALEKDVSALKEENSALKTQNKELEAVLEDLKSKEREEEDNQNLPKDQKTVLRALNPPAGRASMLLLRDVSEKTGLAADIVRTHLGMLRNKELAESIPSGVTERWGRTEKGNNLCVAIKLAGDDEEDAEKKPLTLEEAILVILNEVDASPLQSAPTTFILNGLAGMGFVISPQKLNFTLNEIRNAGGCNADFETYGTPVMWFITTTGQKFLNERGRL